MYRDRYDSWILFPGQWEVEHNFTNKHERNLEARIAHCCTLHGQIKHTFSQLAMSLNAIANSLVLHLSSSSLLAGQNNPRDLLSEDLACGCIYYACLVCRDAHYQKYPWFQASCAVITPTNLTDLTIWSNVPVENKPDNTNAVTRRSAQQNINSNCSLVAHFLLVSYGSNKAFSP